MCDLYDNAINVSILFTEFVRKQQIPLFDNIKDHTCILEWIIKYSLYNIIDYNDLIYCNKSRKKIVNTNNIIDCCDINDDDDDEIYVNSINTKYKNNIISTDIIEDENEEIYDN